MCWRSVHNTHTHTHMLVFTFFPRYSTYSKWTAIMGREKKKLSCPIIICPRLLSICSSLTSIAIGENWFVQYDEGPIIRLGVFLFNHSCQWYICIWFLKCKYKIHATIPCDTHERQSRNCQSIVPYFVWIRCE